jgi:lysozyme family protein
MNYFDRCFELLMHHEGGYVNNPHDPGGETNYGITKRVAVDYGYLGEMKAMDTGTAKDIYRALYWNELYERLPFVVAFSVFDAAVNSGTQRSVKWLQEAVGAQQDGILGTKTLAAAVAEPADRVVRRINAARPKFMTGLNTWGTFGKGWARRIVFNLEIGE